MQQPRLREGRLGYPIPSHPPTHPPTPWEACRLWRRSGAGEPRSSRWRGQVKSRQAKAGGRRAGVGGAPARGWGWGNLAGAAGAGVLAGRAGSRQAAAAGALRLLGSSNPIRHHHDHARLSWTLEPRTKGLGKGIHIRG